MRVSGCPITKSPLGKRTCKLRGHTQRAHMGAHVHGLKKPSHHSITKDKFWCRHVQTVYTIRQHTTPLCYTAQVYTRGDNGETRPREREHTFQRKLTCAIIWGKQRETRGDKWTHHPTHCHIVFSAAQECACAA